MAYFARRPFGYGRLGTLDRGEVFELSGLPNDEKLVRLGFAVEYTDKGGTSDCGDCGKRFIGDAERAAHGSDRHRERDLSPEEEESRIERRDRMLETSAPIFWENTKATQASGQAPVPRVASPVAERPAATVAKRRAPRAKREPSTI